MKSTFYYALISIFSLLVIIGCSDSQDRMGTDILGENLRIEYSKCTACLECIEDFQCPEGAIIYDEERLVTYIDTDKCTGCAQCITDFTCKDDAFTNIEDSSVPGMVDDLTSTFCDTSITLFWTAPGDDSDEGRAYGYRIYYSTNVITADNLPDAQEIDNNMIPKEAGNIESFVIDFLEYGHTYYFTVFGIDEDNNEASLSNVEECIYNDITAPAAITDLDVSYVGENTITLEWTSPGDDQDEGLAAGYIIKQFTTEITDGNWDFAHEIGHTIIPLAPGNTETFTMDGLTAGLTSHFAIKAFDDRNNMSGISNSVSATTADLQAPAAITDLRTANITQTSVDLLWSAVGDDGNDGIATAYVVKSSQSPINDANWDAAETHTQSIEPAEPGTEESFTVSSLLPGGVYYFAVKAVDNFDNISLLSNVAQAQIESDQEAPAAITGLGVQVVENTMVLSWDAVGDDGNNGTATGYIIKYSLDGISESSWDEAVEINNDIAPQTAGSPEEFVFDSPESNNEYFFAIKAFDDSYNIGALSNVVSAEIIDVDNTPPSAITDLEPNYNQYSAYNRKITIDWSAPGDDGDDGTASSYAIKYTTPLPLTEANWGSATTVTNPPMPQAAGTNQNYGVNNLAVGVDYYFGIKATDDSDNESDLSNSPVARLVYKIVPSICNMCGRCYPCPEGAISTSAGTMVIDLEQCTYCGECDDECNRNAVQYFVINPYE